MLRLAWRMLCSRWPVFAGTFIALSLGVCLIATALLCVAATLNSTNRMPLWYPNASVVIAGANTVAISQTSGQSRSFHIRATASSLAVPAEILVRLAAVDGVAEIVPDRRVPVVVDGTATTARPWSSLKLLPHTFLAGGPPAAGQVVLTAPAERQPGDRVTIQTPDGPRRWVVAGVVAADVAAVYLPDAVAAELAAGRIDAIGLMAADGVTAEVLAERVHLAAGLEGLRMLTGDARRAAQPDPDAELLAVALALLGNTAGISACAAVFVLIGTFSFAVAQRRREFALLRTAGATPRQVYRLVLGEALALGVLAAVAGCALGTLVAPWFARWLAGASLAPANFTARVTWWPLAVAASAGLLVALLGSGVAAFRASRVRPIEALSEVSLDRRMMTPGKWISGILLLGGAIVLVPIITEASSGAVSAYIIGVTLLMLFAFAQLAPILIPIIVRVAGRPFPGAIGMLARSHALSGLRRTNSTAAPILITIGLAASALASTATLSEAEQQAARDRIAAPVMVAATSTAGLADPVIVALSEVPGVRDAVPTRQSVVYIDTGNAGDYAFPAIYVPAGIESVLRLPSVEGAIAALRGSDTIAVSQRMARAQNWRLGGTAQLTLVDSALVRLRVVAILPDSADLGRTVLLPWELQHAHESRGGAGMVYLALDQGVSAGMVAAAVERIAVDAGGHVVSTAGHLAERSNTENRINRLALLATVGLAVLYTAIAIANTFIMATTGRARDLAVLRLSGATPGQVLAMIALETCLTGMAAMVLAAIVATATLAVTLARLSSVMAQPAVAIPWPAIALVAVSCLLIALIASLVTAALTLRRPAVRLAAVRG